MGIHVARRGVSKEKYYLWMLGTSLAHYEILDRLGKGGMGEVFLARDTRLARRIALKVLPGEMARDGERLERFQREARIVAALNHPNIVTIHSVEEADGQHFLTMELVSGSTLEGLIRDEGMEVSKFLEVAVQVADALAAAHESGVTHRDLKPGNLMVDERGRIKVLDFGLAKVEQQQPEFGDSALATEGLTQEGLVVGTLPYMSPEQVQGRDIDPRSDIFSLGIVLYELLSGRRPFAGDSSAGLISSLLRDDPPAIDHQDSALGSQVDAILERCLEKEPTERYPDAGALLLDLRQLEQQLRWAANAPIVPTAGKTSQRPTLIGREPEAERLDQALERARNGQGALLLLAGEAGVGKTRLAQYAQDKARQTGFLALVGHSRDMEGAQPYLALIEQIEEAARVVDPAALRAALGPNASEVAKLMPDLRQRFDDIPDPVVLPPDQERRYVLHGVSEFIERSARRQPMLLVYEDLHWSDESTLFLLRHLAHRLESMPVMVVATYRQTEVNAGSALATVLQDLLRERLVEELMVDRLPRDAVAELIEDRAGKPAPQELIDRVFSETDGNPFFVEEVYRHLRETGQLFDDSGEWQSGVHRAETEVPRSVGLVIGQRLERVSRDCKKVLTTAAVVGRSFGFDMLAEVSGLDEDRLLDAIDEAEDANLIEDATIGREARYSFVHEPIRNALLAELSLPRRQRLHLRLGKLLDERHHEDAERHAIEIAHHLWEAGASADEERTFEYLLLAASRTRERLAFEESLRYLEKAEQVLPSDDAEALSKVLLSRARAERALGRVDEALETFKTAIDQSQSGDPLDEILYARARLWLDLFRGAEAVEDIERLLEVARGAGDRERELRLLLDLARAHYVLSLDNPREFAQTSRDLYEQAHALADELGDRRGMVKALIPTIWFDDYWPEYRPRAVENIEQALRIARELGDDGLELEASAAQLRFLRPNESNAPAKEVRRRLEERGDPIRLKEVYFLLMWDYWVRGELEECVDVCSAAIELAEQLGTEPVQYPSIKSLALVDLGRFDEARRALDGEVADEEHRFGRCMQQLALANYLARLGAHERAVEIAIDTLEEASHLQRAWMRSWMVDLLHLLWCLPGVDREAIERALSAHIDAKPFRTLPYARSERLLADGDSEAALDSVRRSVASVEKHGLSHVRLGCLAVELRVLTALERWSELLGVAEDALELAEESGADEFSWRILALESQALSALGSRDVAAKQLAAARDKIESVASTIDDPNLKLNYLEDPLALILFEPTP